MGRLRPLSGNQVISILHGFGFAVHDQHGSHVKLRRASAGGANETMVVPLHRDLDRGTLHALFRQASRYIPPGGASVAVLFED